jgi:uncharacterized protein (TIGR02246 family)
VISPTFCEMWEMKPPSPPDSAFAGNVFSTDRKRSGEIWSFPTRYLRSVFKPFVKSLSTALLYRRSMRTLLLLLVGTIAASSRAQVARISPSPEAIIRRVLEQQTEDWNRGDVDAFMKAYENSPTTTFVGKTVEYGYDTILERYKELYTTPASMGTLTFSHLAIRILDSGYATATGNFHLERTAAGGGNANGIFSLLLKKNPQGWKIILDHSNRVD